MWVFFSISLLCAWIDLQTLVAMIMSGLTTLNLIFSVNDSNCLVQY